ncbi:PH domain-containing protein [Candidatus Bathyarchaeota archaeon]|nr:PH domain-containing protein [Candidatus Bathyarchaeota archaeon]
MVLKVDEGFRPHVDMKKLYYSYLTIGVILFGLSWIIPAVVVALLVLPLAQAYAVTAALLFPLLAVVCSTAFWIQKYYSSITYTLANDEIVVERGVWWKRKSFVPYNRITNINIVQGPIARQFGLGTVRVQTAGFSGGGSAGGRVAEAVILGVKNFEEIRNVIMGFVKRVRPVAVEAEAEAPAPRSLDRQILNELRRIRKALESK